MRVYIGFDPEEPDAYRVAEKSLRRRATIPVDVTPLNLDQLRMQGLITRPMDARGGLYDLHSNAPCSTEFAISRFVVPMLAQSGPALFVDSDVVFLADVAELLELFDPAFALQVVQHEYVPAEATKMVGIVQTRYRRKNWSSVVFWNASHHAHRRLTLDAINRWPGRELHNFSWLHDSEIGELPAAWNWLVNVQPMPADPRLAHFTLGGPFTRGWRRAEHDEIWIREAA